MTKIRTWMAMEIIHQGLCLSARYSCSLKSAWWAQAIHVGGCDLLGEAHVGDSNPVPVPPGVQGKRCPRIVSVEAGPRP